MKRIVVLGFLVACGGGKHAAPPAPERMCHVRLVTEAAAGSPPPPLRASRIVAHAQLSLAAIKKELEAKIPVRLAEERGRDIGIAGSLNYTIDRGPLSVAVQGDALVVTTDIKARAEACAKGSCYAGCEPTARAAATVSLRLGPDFRFAPSRVDARLNDRCFVRALFVRIDVTPILEGQLGPALRRVERDIDQRLPPLRPQAERIWSEVSKAREIPFGGCVVVAPKGIVQGPISGTADTARLRFGLVAHPEVRRSCGDSVQATPLPPLAQDPGMREDEDVLVGLVGPTSSLDVSYPARDSCTDVAAASGFAWSPDLADIAVTDARITPPFVPRALAEVVPPLTASLTDPQLDVAAAVKETKPAEVFLRGDDLVARVLMRGSVEIRQK